MIPDISAKTLEFGSIQYIRRNWRSSANYIYVTELRRFLITFFDHRACYKNLWNILYRNSNSTLFCMEQLYSTIE